jgi:hypothetical protein
VGNQEILTTMHDDIPRKLPARQGLLWVNNGFALYRKNPLMLSAGFVALFAVLAAASLIPFVGESVSDLLSPLMVAGFMAAFRTLDREQPLHWTQFLVGANDRWLPLVTIGAVQLLGMLVIAQIMQAMGFDAAAVVAAAQKGDPQAMQSVMGTTMPAVLTGLLLFTPLIMATWFAPALVLFGNARPTQALVISLRAVTKNWPALTVNGIALGIVLFVAALVPFLLGLLVVMPLVFGSLYASYQGIFAVWDEETPVLVS